MFVLYVCMYLSSFSIPYGYQLLSNDRQHFNVNSVKLIKTAPSSRLSKSTEETTHYLEEKMDELKEKTKYQEKRLMTQPQVIGVALIHCKHKVYVQHVF